MIIVITIITTSFQPIPVETLGPQ